MKSQQKLDPVGQSDKITECGTAIKQQTGEEDKPVYRLARHLKGFSQGIPYTVKYTRHEDKEGGKEGELDQRQEGFGHGKKGQFLVQMGLDAKKQERGEEIQSDGAGNDCRPEQTNGLSEFGEKV